MKWEKVRAPSAPLARTGGSAQRRTVPGWLPLAVGGALILSLVVLTVAARKPAAPELLRPHRPDPAAAAPAAGREYRSENVILRFPESDADKSDLRR